MEMMNVLLLKQIKHQRHNSKNSSINRHREDSAPTSSNRVVIFQKNLPSPPRLPAEEDVSNDVGLIQDMIKMRLSQQITSIQKH
jgi:hypothetical protein